MFACRRVRGWKFFSNLRRCFRFWDQRKLQHEVDLHRLFLVTSYREDVASGVLKPSEFGEVYAQRLSKEAAAYGYEELQQEVSGSLARQLMELAGKLAHVHGSDELVSAMDPEPAGGARAWDAGDWGEGDAEASPSAGQQRQRSGLPIGDAAVASLRRLEARTSPAASSSTWPGPAPDSEAAARLRDACGCSLHVAPSGIQHPLAGNGLWLQGHAEMGGIVALHPGLVYDPQHYKHIPGYPNLDPEAMLLISRSCDGSVVDAQPWMRLCRAFIRSQRLPSDESAGLRRLAMLQAQRVVLWGMQWRNALASGHFINHPPPGTRPNVVTADIQVTLPAGSELRPFLPMMAWDGDDASSASAGSSQTLKGVAYVALRPLADEELLVDYRLSTHVGRPEWYEPVDADAERRRWS